MGPRDEIEAIRVRYARRETSGGASPYDPLDPYVCKARQERERALVRWIRHCGLAPVSEKRAIEIGCGIGANLLDLIRLGFRPGNLAGNELIESRLAKARERLSLLHLPPAGRRRDARRRGWVVGRGPPIDRILVDP